ncbi:UDP-N-acetylmuramoylalanyl-D-glutamate--2,6-diaminopimelate ligase [Moraxella cuniculi DSM 21768]|uniref:UDP-N-acetylmuramoyl-L-alanyl-D-glutamate--2,6-diaminopimelate ligase n=1 Tax=Moraxella cuniculi DSM 21768 TaxID=1122245 RepID=A0A1N7DQ04_9GAMM|nr:UDP-N-acetylmuramoyl-L-alanyl-D-glutamate--2,6-diaminopimelate ligase [Moraxella cuniculi]OOS05988.1 UDP-N-acetylmuramoyl-L-alanyl-D-glutamate--2,6-diaminopimelate ligase [Moraxella cuniculi]SIR77962.1 UDP-N-acetylmuramoylalanyl-D-glutamate--2,6-diaminopimelate ligase [Moraxella cuniculi DSM 21768]
MSFQNNIVSIKQVIEQAVNTPSTVAQTKSAWLWQVFAPILACQFGRFCLDSRQVNQGDGFVLLASSSLDEKTSIANANRYLQAIKDKASFVISEIAAEQLDLCDVSIPVLCVPEIRTVLGDLIAARLQLCQPVSLPMVIAVTGTNGKTTVSQLIAQLCQAAGIQAAVMGTAGNGRLGALVQAANTTGDVLSVHEFIHQMAQQGVQVIALEASSHGLDQYRLQGVPIVAAVYTNLSHDHLDYHADMQAYRAAKARLFDKAYFPTLSVGVINHDAEYALFDYTKPCGYELYGYGQQTRTDYHTKSVEPSLDGVALQIITPQGELSLHSPLLGLFNVDNLLASVAVFDRLFAEHWTDLPALVANLQGARGRMQRAKSQLGSFIVDYAHTPDALVQVLSSLRRHCTGELIAVFGCGGDRDRSKRMPMTQAGLTHADKVILTADNPRSEDPLDILAQMQEGLKADDYDKIMVEPDRRAAIELAVRCAGEHDIVVIAGKGHETYQEINGVRHDFDDLSVLNEFLTKYQK